MSAGRAIHATTCDTICPPKLYLSGGGAAGIQHAHIRHTPSRASPMANLRHSSCSPGCASSHMHRNRTGPRGLVCSTLWISNSRRKHAVIVSWASVRPGTARCCKGARRLRTPMWRLQSSSHPPLERHTLTVTIHRCKCLVRLVHRRDELAAIAPPATLNLPTLISQRKQEGQTHSSGASATHARPASLP